MANRLGHAVDHVIPFDKRIVVAANTGEPYVLWASRLFGCGRQLRRLVDEIDAMGDGRPLCPLCPAASGDGEVQPIGDEHSEASEEDSQ